MSFSSPEKLPFIQLVPPLQSLLLATMLLEHNVLSDAWGEGKSKTLSHLVTEINTGETSLTLSQRGEVIRQIQVVHIDVFHRKDNLVYQLFETKQVFNNGRVRLRGLSGVNEKIKQGELYYHAAYRALAEELGIYATNSMYYLGSALEKHASRSYPGLMTHSEKYDFQVWLEPRDFNPDGYVEVQDDKKTYFVWKVICRLTV